MNIKESKKIEKYLELAREQRKLKNMKVIAIVVGKLEMILKGLEKRLWGTGDQRKNWDQPNHSTVNISWNT